MHLQGMHTNSIYGCAFSPDGTTLALVSNDATASLVDAASGERRLHLQGLHTGSIRGCAFSPDGATLALVSSDKTASILNTASAPALVFAQTLLPTNQVCVSSTIHTKVLEEDGSREGEGSCVRACFRNFVNHPSTEEWSSGAKRYRRLQKQAIVHGGASGTTHAHGRYDRHSQYFEAEWLCCSHSDFPVYVSEHVRACARRGSKKCFIGSD